MSNLKEIRLDRDMTQEKLEQVSGVNVRIIRAYEQGKREINKAQGVTLYKLAQALKCNIEDLLEIERIKKEVEE